ncbi:helix-turn-helix domain-containing protein [Photobacterium makurazakiensis]|uniref:Crp/Fnr family transcriptional regulator n=1 Tax=Photobacterium makurazakiensis TaxID=2910234 RepID=UPI003D0DA31D
MNPFNFDKIIWPCELPEQVKGYLLDISKYKKGISSLDLKNSHISKPGLIYVIHGSASFHFSTNDYQLSAGTIMGRGDWLGAMSIKSNTELFFHIDEIEDLHMLVFPEKQLVELADSNPQIYKLLYSAGQYIHKISLQSVLSSIHNKIQKIIYCILEIELRQKYIEGNEILIKISQTQLSAISGVSRCRLNESLKEMEEQSLIKLKIFLLDKVKLQDVLLNMNLMYRDEVMSR